VNTREPLDHEKRLKGDLNNFCFIPRHNHGEFTTFKGCSIA
jgi:hypothetical protein